MNHSVLFSERIPEYIVNDYSGVLWRQQNIISSEQANSMFGYLLEALAWNQEKLKIVGRVVDVPRLVAWYGEAQAIYTYSGKKHLPLPWLPVLLDLKQKLETVTSGTFNSVLANLYRTGSDSMGWHADNEKELGDSPLIASISFGAARLFKVRKHDSGETIDITLGSGDLLVMAGKFQRHWRHCIPKTRRPVSQRINLTFRKIIH